MVIYYKKVLNKDCHLAKDCLYDGLLCTLCINLDKYKSIKKTREDYKNNPPSGENPYHEPY